MIKNVQLLDAGVYVCCVKSSNGSSILTKGAEVIVNQHMTIVPTEQSVTMMGGANMPYGAHAIFRAAPRSMLFCCVHAPSNNGPNEPTISTNYSCSRGWLYPGPSHVCSLSCRRFWNALSSRCCAPAFQELS